MDADAFWQVVATTRTAAGGDIRRQTEELRAHLVSLPLDDVAAFDAHFDDAHDRSYRWDLWGAAYVLMGGCSDDSFDYFRAWLVAQGADVFERALADPETLADVVADPEQLEEDVADAELLWYVAQQVYEQRAGHALARRTSTRPAEPLGDPWDEDDLDERFPRLCALVDW